MQYRQSCGKCGAIRIDQQIGLEPTPELYVAKMVAVFAEVRRVLRADGTLWLNMGSSYASNPGKGGSGTFNGRNGYGESYARGMRPSQSLSRQSAPACGSGDTERLDSTALDYAYSDLCDGCRAVFQNRTSGTPRLTEPVWRPREQTVRDSETEDSEPIMLAAAPLDAQASTTSESSLRLQGECCHCANCGACLAVLRSSSRDARLCARNSVCTPDTIQQFGTSAYHRRGTGLSSEACSTITFPQFKPKDLVPTPWMLAMALQADGWYLRSDIIWSKANPMPESVTDRPTKSHEYIFLMSKSEKYYYDQEAILEPVSQNIHMRLSQNLAAQIGSHRANGGGKTNGPMKAVQRKASLGEVGVVKSNPSFEAAVCLPVIERNKRSVWTVNTQSFSEAHFATFPEELIKPCILAGCPAQVCSACGAPIGERYDDSNLQTVSQEIQDVSMPERSQSILFKDMPTPIAQEGSGFVPNVRQADTVQEGECGVALLRQGVRVPLVSEAPMYNEGLCNNDQGLQADMDAGTSQCSAWLRDGASSGNGTENRTTAPAGGSGSSQEWQKARQPRKQSRIDGEGGPRQTPEATANVSLPTLREADRAHRCQACGADLSKAGSIGSGTVLDPFGGSGTTALVARANGCKAILIELNPKYIKMAEKRLSQNVLEWEPV